MYLPGLLHILSNASKDLLSVTENFTRAYSMMEALTLWLHDKQTREHSVATCLSLPPYNDLKPLFSSFKYTLVG